MCQASATSKTATKRKKLIFFFMSVIGEVVIVVREN